jgi:hypothetical protein
MWRAGRWGRRGMDLDNLQLWGGHQPHAGACTPPVVQGLLDSRQPSISEVPMRLIGLAVILSLIGASLTG